MQLRGKKNKTILSTTHWMSTDKQLKALTILITSMQFLQVSISLQHGCCAHAKLLSVFSTVSSSINSLGAVFLEDFAKPLQQWRGKPISPSAEHVYAKVLCKLVRYLLLVSESSMLDFNNAQEMVSQHQQFHLIVESLAQVVGPRTRDQKVSGSNLETGLNFKVVVKL